MKRFIIYSCVLSLFLSLLAACASNTTSTGASRTQQVQITETDYHIASSTTKFTSGEHYQFVIENNGQVAHEFMIMPSSSDMTSGMPMNSMDKQALAHVENITPGQTVTLDYTFASSATRLHPQLACYYPGHYQAGMKLSISVVA